MPGTSVFPSGANPVSQGVDPALAVRFDLTRDQPDNQIRGASGNVASEDVLYMLNGMGIGTGVDFDKLVAAGRYISDFLGRQPVSRVARALAVNPNSASAHINLGRALTALGQAEAGEPHLRRAAELMSRRAE